MYRQPRDNEPKEVTDASDIPEAESDGGVLATILGAFFVMSIAMAAFAF